MKVITLSALVLLSSVSCAYSQADPKSCAAMNDAGERLLCYDALFREVSSMQQPPDTANTKWELSSTKSKIDDTESKTLLLDSDDDFAGKFRGRQKATLVVRCHEKATSLYFILGDHFLADIQGYGEITYRVDEKKAAKKTFNVSTDNKALGLWSGGAAIAFVKQMLGAKKLVIRATPYNESAITATFDISGIDDAVKPVREGCKW